MVAHCLFEQSGTFKNEFKKLGIDAYDYDIENNFEQTDFQIDLFSEIRGGYEGKPSIFDNIAEDDIVLAFFPCIRFSANTLLLMSEKSVNFRGMSNEDIIKQTMIYNQEQYELYQLFSKMFIIALRKNIHMIIENPATQPHYLTWYFPIKSTFIDADRTRRGDYYKKPTQYWFVNCKPSNNFIFGWEKQKTRMSVNYNHGFIRSMISPDYANRFIREFILKEEDKTNED